MFCFKDIVWSTALHASMMTFLTKKKDLGILTIHPRSVCIDILGKNEHVTFILQILSGEEYFVMG
jgi:hypothetical protein